MSWFHREKNEWPPNSPDLKQLDYRVGRDAGMLSEIHAKTAQYCRAEDDCLAIDMDMICHRSSLINDKAISSFRKRL